ncbi:hypothetical protein BH23PLA1_BH23PLA1_05620 [soil metagenome]
MSDLKSSRPLPKPCRWAAGLLLAGLLVLGGLAALGVWPSIGWTGRGRDRQSSRPVSPYKNTRPKVAYVGDEACIRCHEEIATSYREHPMGRSLVPIDRFSMSLEPEEVHIEAMGLEYSAEDRDGRLFHIETRRDGEGRVVARTEAEVQYALGSGTRGVSFLIERGEGFLFQSPISWYTQEQAWDLAPSYRQHNAHFERPITHACLFCHAGRTEPVERPANRYREPIFRQHAIGCERCHGPGELHVKALGGIDDDGIPTIVNPADLEPSLREAVCQQCHLLGNERVERFDRGLADYRPGFPLHEFLSVFIDSGDAPAGNRAVSHVEQMHLSACYLGSGGALGCISCHDPHRRPDPAEAVAYYRGRCMECHQDRGCALPIEARLDRSPEDSCTACHMPQAAITTVAHTASTLHHIPRFAETPPTYPADAEPARPETRDLMHFHRGISGEEHAATIRRDLGIALSRASRRQVDVFASTRMARAAAPLLDEAVQAEPADAPAWEALGTALLQLRRRDEALTSFEKALARSPTEEALDAAIPLAARLDRPEEALELARQLVELNPWRSGHHRTTAYLHADAGRWSQAVDSCRNALRLNPADIEARRLLIGCFLQLGDPNQARAEAEALLAFNPPERDELRQLIEQLR